MNELNEIRKRIEETDKKMAALFIERMTCVKEIADYKYRNNIPILDTGREKELLEKNGKYINDEDLLPHYIKFMQSILDISKQYQAKLKEDRG